MHHTLKKVACIGCISLTKVASRLQRMIFRLQKLRFAYKYLVVRLQNCVSGYKTASRFSIELKEGIKEMSGDVTDCKTKIIYRKTINLY